MPQEYAGPDDDAGTVQILEEERAVKGKRPHRRRKTRLEREQGRWFQRRAANNMCTTSSYVAALPYCTIDIDVGRLAGTSLRMVDTSFDDEVEKRSVAVVRKGIKKTEKRLLEQGFMRMYSVKATMKVLDKGDFKAILIAFLKYFIANDGALPMARMLCLAAGKVKDNGSGVTEIEGFTFHSLDRLEKMSSVEESGSLEPNAENSSMEEAEQLGMNSILDSYGTPEESYQRTLDVDKKVLARIAKLTIDNISEAQCFQFIQSITELYYYILTLAQGNCDIMEYTRTKLSQRGSKLEAKKIELKEKLQKLFARLKCRMCDGDMTRIAAPCGHLYCKDCAPAEEGTEKCSCCGEVIEVVANVYRV